MAAKKAKKTKPPTFHFLPKTCAKRLKESWVRDHKIRSKWRVQKRRECLTNRTSEDAANRRRDDIDAGPELETSLNHPNRSPTPSPTLSHDKQSLRDLRKIAYSSQPRCAQETRPSPRGGKTAMGRGKGQPNMKLRMNLLLEKIKRDLS